MPRNWRLSHLPYTMPLQSRSTALSLPPWTVSCQKRGPPLCGSGAVVPATPPAQLCLTTVGMASLGYMFCTFKTESRLLPLTRLDSGAPELLAHDPACGC